MVTSLFLWLFIPFSPLNPNLGKKRLEVEEERKRSRLCFILFWIVNNRRRIRRLFPYLFRRTVLSFFRSALSLYPFASSCYLFPLLLLMVINVEDKRIEEIYLWDDMEVPEDDVVDYWLLTKNEMDKLIDKISK